VFTLCYALLFVYDVLDLHAVNACKHFTISGFHQPITVIKRKASRSPLAGLKRRQPSSGDCRQQPTSQRGGSRRQLCCPRSQRLAVQALPPSVCGCQMARTASAASGQTRLSRCADLRARSRVWLLRCFHACLPGGASLHAQAAGCSSGALLHCSRSCRATVVHMRCPLLPHSHMHGTRALQLLIFQVTAAVWLYLCSRDSHLKWWL
jgi:hypothetical protein